MSHSIDVLPKEILQHVFSYLNMDDRLNVSLVCRKWLSVMNCKVLLRDILVFINDNNKVPVLTCMSRNFMNFSFKLIIVDKKYHELFKRFSAVVEYISFDTCEIWKREPVIFDDLIFENLKVLEVIDCDLWALLPGVPNLLELYLSGNSTITDDGLAILQRSMKHLEILSLYCNVAFDPKAYKRFYVHESYEKNPSPYILSLPAIKSFISERVSTITELNFYYNLTEQALKEISSIENLHLYKIGLRSCQGCAGSLIDLFKNQPSLKILDLNGIMSLNNDVINALHYFIPDVEKVYIHDCSLSEESFSKILQLKKLRTLDIGKSYASESGFYNAIINFAPANLEVLNVSAFASKNIDLLIKKCNYLVYLNLSHCAVSDELLHFISENLIHLENLNLKRTDITDYGLTGKDEFRDNESMDEDDDEYISACNSKHQPLNEDNRKPISNLKNLKKLKLNDCDQITDLGIVQAIRFQYLEYLNLSRCRIDSSTVETLLLQNPNIKKIYCDFSSGDPKVLKKKSKYDFMVDDEFADLICQKC